MAYAWTQPFRVSIGEHAKPAQRCSALLARHCLISSGRAGGIGPPVLGAQYLPWYGGEMPPKEGWPQGGMALKLPRRDRSSRGEGHN